MTTFYVYTHRNPTTNEVFYVGKGHGNRAYRHAPRSKQWQARAAEHGIAVVIEMTTEDEEAAFAAERELIMRHREIGSPIINQILGGGLRTGQVSRSLEQRTAVSIRNTGRKLGPMSEAEKEKRRIANTGKRMKPESIEKTAAAHRGAKRSEQTLERMRAAQQASMADPKRKKAVWTEEMRLQVSQRSKGRVASDEAREKMREAWRTKRKPLGPQSPEHIAKRVEAFNRSIERRRLLKQQQDE